MTFDPSKTVAAAATIKAGSTRPKNKKPERTSEHFVVIFLPSNNSFSELMKHLHQGSRFEVAKQSCNEAVVVNEQKLKQGSGTVEQRMTGHALKMSLSVAEG